MSALRAGAGVVPEGISPENSRQKKRDRPRDHEVKHEPGGLTKRLNQQFRRDVGDDDYRNDPSENELKNARENNIRITGNVAEIKVAVNKALGAQGERPLSPAEVGLSGGWEGRTPLWLYLLREADVRAHGDRLGPVGGRIVAAVLLGIVDADPASYRSADPSWRPTLPAAQDGSFGLEELLAFSSA